MKILGMLVSAAAMLFASACDQNGSAQSMSASINYWSMQRDAKKAYPNLPKNEAQLQYAKRMIGHALMNESDPAKKQWLATQFYLGYAFMVGRAVPDYCSEMNFEMDGLRKLYRSQNRLLERQADKVLESRGLTREDVWNRAKGRLKSSAKAQLVNPSGVGGGGSYDTCKVLRDQPHLLTSRVQFSSQFSNVVTAMNLPLDGA